MRRWRGIGCFILSSGIVLAGLWWVSESRAPVFGIEKRRIAQLIADRDRIQAMTFGNSTNEAIDFDRLGLRGYHLWTPGSDIFEIHYQIRALSPFLPNLELLLISGQANFDNAPFPERTAVRRICYATTPGPLSFLPIRGDFRGLILGKLSPIVRPDHWREILLGPEEIDPAPALAPDGHIGRIRSRKLRRTQHLVNDVKRRFGSRGSRVPTDPGARHARTREIGDLYEGLFNDLRARGVRIVFYLPPASDIFWELETDEMREFDDWWAEVMHELGRRAGTEYYDFAKDPQFVSHHEYFDDLAHLNRQGAALFSGKLARLLGAGQSRSQGDTALVQQPVR